jgi:hypothetical protein
LISISLILGLIKSTPDHVLALTQSLDPKNIFTGTLSEFNVPTNESNSYAPFEINKKRIWDEVYKT